MQWLSILAALACPLMMVFCMKGMLGGHKHGAKENTSSELGVTSQELQSLQIKMAELMEQNHHLSKEIESLKQPTKESSKLNENSINVVN